MTKRPGTWCASAASVASAHRAFAVGGPGILGSAINPYTHGRAAALFNRLPLDQMRVGSVDLDDAVVEHIRLDQQM